MELPLDYGTLRVIWWLLLGVLLSGFAVMGGIDLGVAFLLRVIGRSDSERRVMINCIGPTWDGNQVWLVLGAGAVFAAFPPIYAAAFSTYYLALMLALATLILRPGGFDYRSKLHDPRWRGFWDWALFSGGLVVPLVFGIAVGTLFVGAPFTVDETLRISHEGGLLSLLRPFPLFCGVVAVAMLATHGGAFLVAKTDGVLQARARTVVTLGALLTLGLFALGGLWVAFGLEGLRITSAVDPAGPSNPLLKQVVAEPGAWLANYGRLPVFLLAPILGLGGALAALVLVRLGAENPVVVATGTMVASIVATAGVSLFPFIMPSRIEAVDSLTVWDATSSHLTLFLMLVAAIIFMPIILAYTSFVFRVMRGKVSADAIERDSHSHY